MRISDIKMHVEPSDIPDGEYNGWIIKHDLSFSDDQRNYTASTNRYRDHVFVTVVVNGGEIEVREHQPAARVEDE